MGRSAQSGLKVTTAASPRALGQSARRCSPPLSRFWRRLLCCSRSPPDPSSRLSFMQRAGPPNTLPCRQHRRAKPRLSTDNEAVAAQHGRPGRTGGRRKGEGVGESGWTKPRPNPRPHWWAPRFWARPLTDLSHCDRWKGQFLLGRGRSQR